MLRDVVLGRLSPKGRLRIRRIVRSAEKSLASLVFRYGPSELSAALARLGIRPGDTVLVHSAFRHASGFTGTPRDVVACLVGAVGYQGNLLMVSLPFRTSAYEHLRSDPVFDVRRTVSQMGIVSEVFRRRSDVRRSLHPTHPVLARGKDADWLVRDHEKSLAPCGPESPFGRLRERGGKVLFFDVPFANFTFLHYLEDLLEGSVPFPIYREGTMRARILDHEGRPGTVETKVFSEEAIARRDPELLEARLRALGLLRSSRVGGTRLLLVGVEDAVRTTLDMRESSYFYRPAEVRR